jgi:Anti-sigma-K factor rskA
MLPDDHQAWSELAAGFALSALDEADEATYIEHAVSCEACRTLEQDFSEVIADLSLVSPAVTPPASLKASIMRAVLEDDGDRAPVIPLAARRDTGQRAARAGSDATTLSQRVRSMPTWLLGAAAAVVAVALVATWILPVHKQASVAARCAAVNCPVVTLTGAGQPLAAVMILDDSAYIDPHGLPPTPTGDVYVLWSLSNGKSPVGVAALHTVPNSGPVRAGAFTTPIGDVTGFAVTEERGDSIPSTPSEHLLAQGSRV